MKVRNAAYFLSAVVFLWQMNSFHPSIVQGIEVLNLCQSGLGITQIPIWVAQDIGAFVHYGTKVRIIFIQGGTTSARAMIAGAEEIRSQPRTRCDFCYHWHRSRLAAVQRGHVSATMSQAPFTLMAKKAGLRLVATLADLDIPYQHVGLATTRSFIRREREALKGLLRGYAAGIYYLKSQPVESKKIIARHLRLDSAELVDEVYREFEMTPLIGAEIIPVDAPFQGYRGGRYNSLHGELDEPRF